MKFTKEQMAAIKQAIADKKEHQLEGIRGAVGDAFNAQTLAGALARVEAESYIDSGVIQNRRYATLVPVDTTTQASIGTALVKSFTDSVGEGSASSGSGNDANLVEVIYGSQSIQVGAGDIAYKYSVPELQAASANNVPLQGDKVNAARRGYERHMNKLAMIGDAKTGVKGLLNHDIPEVVAASDSWNAGSIDAIMNDLSNAISKAYDDAVDSGDLSQMPDTILLPAEIMRKLANTRIGVNSERTLLSFIKDNNLLTESGVQNVRFESLKQLDTASESGGRRIVVYRRDPSALELILPQDLEFLAPQAKGLDVVTYGWYLYAGLWIKSKNAVVYLDDV